MFKVFVNLPILTISLILYLGISIFGQDGSGRPNPGSNPDKDKPIKKPPAATPVKKPSPDIKKPPQSRPRKDNSPPKPSSPNQNENSTQANACVESELLIRCFLPECSVLVDGKSQGISDINGELRLAVNKGKRNIEVSKNGYETRKDSVSVSCGELKQFDARLTPKPFDIKIKTNLPESDIFVNDQFIGKSDKNGHYTIPAKSGTVLVQAKKTDYIADSLSVSPATAQKEIKLNLKPIPPRIVLNTNVSDAYLQFEGSDNRYGITDLPALEIGRQKLIIAAVGYAPQTIELDLKPNQKIEKTVALKLLPVSELLGKAEQSYKNKLAEETIKLSRYALGVEPENSTANRLLGYVYLDRQNYAEAEPYLRKALDGNETIDLKIRRHFNEKFEVSGGHGAACEGLLILSKNEIEYRGATSAAENFKLPRNQIQILGLQIRKNVALSLLLKVTDARGGKKDYHFFSRDKELSQEGKPFLEMIQRLLR